MMTQDERHRTYNYLLFRNVFWRWVTRADSKAAASG